MFLTLHNSNNLIIIKVSILILIQILNSSKNLLKILINEAIHSKLNNLKYHTYKNLKYNHSKVKILDSNRIIHGTNNNYNSNSNKMNGAPLNKICSKMKINFNGLCKINFNKIKFKLKIKVKIRNFNNNNHKNKKRPQKKYKINNNNKSNNNLKINNLEDLMIHFHLNKINNNHQDLLIHLHKKHNFNQIIILIIFKIKTQI